MKVVIFTNSEQRSLGMILFKRSYGEYLYIKFRDFLRDNFAMSGLLVKALKRVIKDDLGVAEFSVSQETTCTSR